MEIYYFADFSHIVRKYYESDKISSSGRRVFGTERRTFKRCVTIDQNLSLESSIFA